MATVSPLVPFFLPTRADIEALKVGDLALNAFGRLAEVVEIHARREDIKGKLFVCYYTRSEGTTRGQMSMSMKEDELVRHANLRETSAAIDTIEHQLRAERAVGAA